MRSSRVSAVALLLAACGTEPEVRTLVVWPDSVDLVRFDSMQLSVAAQDDQGELIPDVPVTFSSNNTFVVGVSGGGLVRSVGPVGSATVTVSGGGDSKRIPVTVFALPARVIAAPRDTTVPLGQTYPLRVEVLDTDGAPLTSPAATYESSNLAVATVSASGSVTTVGSGTAAIIVRAGGASAGVSVRAYDPNAPAVVEVVPQDTTIPLRERRCRCRWRNGSSIGSRHSPPTP